ncbi:MAG: RNase adapter RapZ [Zoogloeaceae bacterium]|jgi:UPF0042 nucleotide-binding protein|nr:RNase adapter RapZ [Zoogloeaceae bacterium]
MEIVLLSGLSGSGKSVALKALEDRDYYCVDNMPAAMLQTLVALLQKEGCARLAIAIDARSGGGLADLPKKKADLCAAGYKLTFLFLDAQDGVLLQRFSETRRRHPLASDERTLLEAIREERQLLSPLAELGQRLDTSGLRPATLREWVWQSADAAANEGLTLLIESFGFKNGLPLDADLVFDVRCLPNPYYEPDLAPLSGLDAPVAAFLEAEESVHKMRADIRRFIADWLPSWLRDSRAYLTVAIGCTGGQHRSVHIAKWLGEQFKGQVSRVLVRHRSLSARQNPDAG